MDIRNGADGLKTLLGVTLTAPAQEQKGKGRPTAGSNPLGGDHATLSSSGKEVSQTITESVVRADKVAAAQTALAAGTYSVPASAVAGKIVDTMLGGENAPRKGSSPGFEAMEGGKERLHPADGAERETSVAQPRATGNSGGLRKEMDECSRWKMTVRWLN